jgi:hypothetical protein
MNMETADPMLAWLGQRRFLEPETVAAQLRERIFSYPIGYIVVHADLIGRNTSTVQEIVGYFSQLDDLLCHYVTEGDAIVFRTRWHPGGCPGRIPPETASGVYEIDVGSPGDERYLGWGYHWSETVSGLTLRWTGEYPYVDTYVDLPPDSYDLNVTLQAFWETRGVELIVNGTPVGGWVSVGTGALVDYHWRIPASAIGDGQHVQLRLIPDATIVPADVGQSADPRRLAVAIDRMRFTRLN